MNFVLMTKSTFPIIGWFADLFGLIMDILYGALCAVGIESLGVAIIIFTVLTTLIMLPMTISQQKFMKLSNLMQPELKEIQKKYRGKTDNASAARMNAETQAVYERYGVSPTGSCLPLLLQFPIMLGLYQVILKVPAYIGSIKTVFMNIVTPMMQQANYATLMETNFAELASKVSVDMEKIVVNADVAVDFLYKFKPENWAQLQEVFPAISDVVATNLEQINSFNAFLGMNLAENPSFLSLTILIPILAGASQWISTKLMTKRQSNMEETQGMMNSMNTMMPVMSIVFCFMLPIGVGLYWIAGTVVRMIIQIGVDKYMDSQSTEDIIRKNIEKNNKKRAKKGLPPVNEQQMLRNIEKEQKRVEREESKRTFDAEKRDAMQAKSTEYYNSKSGGSGSIASRARMVKDFNERNMKK